jgi:transposase
LVRFLHSIPAHLRATIQEVCTDLHEAFILAVQEVLPQAELVADRFHVAKLAGAACSRVRKTERKELKASLPPDEQHLFQGVLWLLRKHRTAWTKEERIIVEEIFRCAPALRQAYNLRESLYQIFATKQTKAAAQGALRRWMTRVKGSGLSAFQSFLTTLEARLNEISNYFNRRSSSGWVEGLNNKIKVLKRRCYGLTSIPNFFRRRWLDLNGLETFAP